MFPFEADQAVFHFFRNEHGSRWRPRIPRLPLPANGSGYAHRGQPWLRVPYRRSASRRLANGSGAACSNPSAHGWRFYRCSGSGDQRGAETHDLVGCDVHIFHFMFVEDRKITGLTADDLVFDKVPLIIQCDIRALGDFGDIFFPRSGKSASSAHLAIQHLAVGRFEFSISLIRYARRAWSQSDIHSSGVSIVQTAIVGIVYVISKTRARSRLGITAGPRAEIRRYTW